MVRQNLAFLETANWCYELGRLGMGEYPITIGMLKEAGMLLGRMLPPAEIQDEWMKVCNEAYKQGRKDANKH